MGCKGNRDFLRFSGTTGEIVGGSAAVAPKLQSPQRGSQAFMRHEMYADPARGRSTLRKAVDVLKTAPVLNNGKSESTRN